MPPPLVRDLTRLESAQFDLLVIGGGIYGLTVAADAAQRGLTVALVECGDFGSGTSFNHLRTIHGGLRYLQTLDLGRARESIRERRTVARIAPWAIRPVPFVLPLDDSLTRGPMAMRAAFVLDRLIASDRNDELPAEVLLPGPAVLHADDARRRYPELNGLDLSGAAVWYDYITEDADRLTFSWALAAASYGATLANYVEAIHLTNTHRGCVAGAVVSDRRTGAQLEVSARTVVNATGARVNTLLEPFAATVTLPLMQAMNLVTKRAAPACAIGGRGPSGRNFFLVPWRGRALFGTWESGRIKTSIQADVERSDIAAFLDELNVAFPSMHLTMDDITLVHRGTVPAHVRSGHPPSLEGHDLVFDHRAGGLEGLTSVVGTKYTTARAVAERVVDGVFTSLGATAREARSASTPLPHVALVGEALLRHAATHEMVMTLEDAVMRRTPIGALGTPDGATLQRAAEIVGDALGWTAERRVSELVACNATYTGLDGAPAERR